MLFFDVSSTNRNVTVLLSASSLSMQAITAGPLDSCCFLTALVKHQLLYEFVFCSILGDAYSLGRHNCRIHEAWETGSSAVMSRALTQHMEGSKHSKEIQLTKMLTGTQDIVPKSICRPLFSKQGNKMQPVLETAGSKPKPS